MLRSLTLAFMLVLAGCVETQTVTRAELDHLKSQRREPKVSMWYYVGSRDGFHYFRHEDLGSEKVYRISDRELEWPDSFSLTKERKHWRALRWGVHEKTSA
jgi:hypothetical protein